MWVYVYQRTHDKLTITGVSLGEQVLSPAGVTVPNKTVGCDGTADIIGTITTNGYGGPISYQWVRDTAAPTATLTVDDASGSNTVRVELKWEFHGKGAGEAVAKLRVLTPNSGDSTITFPYSCS